MPSHFPNVDIANDDAEVHALEARYEQECAKAEALAKCDALEKLETCVRQSVACKAMPRWELDRLISSDTATAATYYQQIQGRCRIPDDNQWDRLRRIADAAFFQSASEDIQFAALSTNGRWLQNYGDGAVFFKDAMIAHRATVFETNTAQWFAENNGISEIPPGYRATWGKRSTLATAKLAGAACHDCSDIDSLLLSGGESTASDQFIEVHICGSYTIRSVNGVVVRAGAFGDLGLAAAKERAANLSFSFSVAK
jgi:hypothetical protein